MKRLVLVPHALLVLVGFAATIGLLRRDVIRRQEIEIQSSGSQQCDEHGRVQSNSNLPVLWHAEACLIAKGGVTTAALESNANVPDAPEFVGQVGATAKRILDLTPHDSVAKNNYSWAVLLLGHDAEGLNGLRQAVEGDGSDPFPHISYAIALKRLGQDDEALREAAFAVSRKPSLLRSEAVNLIIGGNLSRFREVAANALRLDETGEYGPVPLAWTAQLFYECGQANRAKELATQALSQQPSLGEMWRLRALVETQDGDSRQARIDRLRATFVTRKPNRTVEDGHAYFIATSYDGPFRHELTVFPVPMVLQLTAQSNSLRFLTCELSRE